MECGTNYGLFDGCRDRSRWEAIGSLVCISWVSLCFAFSLAFIVQGCFIFVFYCLRSGGVGACMSMNSLCVHRSAGSREEAPKLDGFKAVP